MYQQNDPTDKNWVSVGQRILYTINIKFILLFDGFCGWVWWNAIRFFYFSWKSMCQKINSNIHCYGQNNAQVRTCNFCRYFNCDIKCALTAEPTHLYFATQFKTRLRSFIYSFRFFFLVLVCECVCSLFSIKAKIKIFETIFTAIWTDFVGNLFEQRSNFFVLSPCSTRPPSQPHSL